MEKDRIEKLLNNLKRRHFESYYVESKEEAKELILKLVPITNSIGWGGSVTFSELNLKELFNEKGYKVYDRSLGKTKEEIDEIMRQALLSDTFIMSSNAITMDGELFNIDGRGNRLAALCFGPKEVIVIAGINKVVENLDEAIDRVRNYVAPWNSKRLNCNTPCATNDKCFDCVSEECICSQMVVTRLSKPKNKIKVILIGEELGR